MKVEISTALETLKINISTFMVDDTKSKGLYIDACKTADKVIIFKTVFTKAHKSKLKLTDLNISSKINYLRT